MSSIIDALKKSDKNRSKENGTPINDIQFSNQAPQKSRRGFWLLVILLLMVAGGLLAYQQGWHHVVIGKINQWMSQEDSSPKPQQTTAQTAKQPQPVKQQANKQQAQNKPKPAANKLQPPKADEVKAQSKLQPVKNNTEPALTKPVADAKQEDSLTVVSDQRKNADLEKAEQDTAKTENTRQAKDQIKTEVAKQDNERQDLEPTLKQKYLLIHQLDFEIRKNIPQIKLNIHIFDPEPANRMVIVNGIKLVIGDVIEEVVTVKDIVKEGVVLEFNNTLFLIPK